MRCRQPSRPRSPGSGPRANDRAPFARNARSRRREGSFRALQSGRRRLPHPNRCRAASIAQGPRTHRERYPPVWGRKAARTWTCRRSDARRSVAASSVLQGPDLTASILRPRVARSSPGLRPTDVPRGSSGDARAAHRSGQLRGSRLRNQSARSLRATWCWRARFRRAARPPWAEGACDETIRVPRPVPCRLLQIVARLHRFLTSPAGLDTSVKPNRPDRLRTGVRAVFIGIQAECPCGGRVWMVVLRPAPPSVTEMASWSA